MLGMMQASIRGLLLSCLTTYALASNHRFERNYEEDKVIENLSFGQRGTTWADDHRSISGWDLMGDGYTPELYSDRIILTPPWPASRRGALWAKEPEQQPEWEASFEFRVNGPEKGNGNMQFWYTREGKQDIGTGSIYTVGKFDGVGIMVSQAGDKPGVGTVRAFLNDGTINFNSHGKVDNLAFGQCDYSYRNLGKFSTITVEQTFWTFKVLVDGQKCISTYAIHLPHNYHFGLTAQSSAPPDSFEVRSFVVHTIKEGKKVVHDHGTSYKADWHEYDDEKEQWSHDAEDFLKTADRSSRPKTGSQPPVEEQKPILQRRNVEVESSTEPKAMSPEDEAAFNSGKDSARINIIHKQIGFLWSDITRMRQQIDQQQVEVTNLLSKLEGHVHTISGDTDNTKHTVEMLEKEVDVIKNSIRNSVTSQDLKREIGELKEVMGGISGKEFKELLEGIHWKMSDHHEDIHEAFAKNSPRWKFFAFLIIASNVMLLGGYVAYMRRKENSPKKWM